MLGYVIPDKGELKVREYEIYTGYYCGICKYIGRTYGQLPRMALSYDAAFIALFLASVDPAPDQPLQEHCAVHHIKYKTVIRNRAIEYAGDLMLILAWFKLQDDAQDEGKVAAKAVLAALKPIWRKLEAKHPALCRSIDEKLAALNELERANCSSIDRVAEGFAQVMDEIFRDGITWLYGAEDDGEKTPADGETGAGSDEPDAKPAGGETGTGSDEPVADAGEKKPGLHETFAKVGYHLGKWIYLIDAVDDIEENLESGSYNPLLYRFGFRDGTGRYETNDAPGSGACGVNSQQGKDAGGHGDTDMNGQSRTDAAPTETPEAFRARIDEALRFNLFHYLAVISESLETLDIQKNSGIIENVIYFGLNRKTEEILKRIQPEKRRHGQL